MYICDKCGTETASLPTFEEKRPIGYETMTDWSCFCGGEFEKAEPCEVCGKYFPEDDLTNGMCSSCYEGSDDYA